VDAVFAPVIDQAIAGNLVEPGTKVRPTLWLTAAADQAQPGFLVDLLGQFGFAAQAEQEAIKSLAMADLPYRNGSSQPFAPLGTISYSQQDAVDAFGDERLLGHLIGQFDTRRSGG
jgi:hypothetical protein